MIKKIVVLLCIIAIYICVFSNKKNNKENEIISSTKDTYNSNLLENKHTAIDATEMNIL